MKSFKTFIQETARPELLDIANEAIVFLKRTPEGRNVHAGDTDKAEWNGSEVIAGIRHWGKWENPEYSEDEEDYDWQELTVDSAYKIKDYLKEFEKKHSGVKITFSAGEKNWIYIHLK